MTRNFYFTFWNCIHWCGLLILLLIIPKMIIFKSLIALGILTKSVCVHELLMQFLVGVIMFILGGGISNTFKHRWRG